MGAQVWYMLLSFDYRKKNPCYFIYKTVSQFFEILMFSQGIWGNAPYVHETNLISYRTLIKAFYLSSKTN